MLKSKEPILNRPNNYRLSEIALKSGFKFRDIENRKLDWKALGFVDVNKVIENQDYEFLERITPKIIEAPMQSILGTSAIDPAVSSLFRLAQMSLQYMSFCQQFMSHTLHDLRMAFNHIQRKYSNLKHNFKCLEEQHYKAQERIQSLLKENKGRKDVEGPSSLYPCDQCTKNFLTSDSLKSHQQRKHTVIAEKHELSDDNEKDNCYMDNGDVVEEANLNSMEQSTQDDAISPEKKNVPQLNINNNNNDNESIANCTECSQKMKINLSTIAIFSNGNTESHECAHNNEDRDPKKDAVNDGEEGNPNFVKEYADAPNNNKKLDNALIQNAYDTISELKREIVELKNSFETKPCIETQDMVSERSVAAKIASLMKSNDKIDVIEQKFNAFEVMYTDSLIETFRNLDERQKMYMDNIQETIKDIVEKSLGKQDTGSMNTARTKNTIDESSGQNETKTKMDEAYEGINSPSTDIHKRSGNEQYTRKVDQNVTYNSPSDCEDGGTKLICQAEIHTISQDELNGTHQATSKNGKRKTRALEKQATKDVVINELQQRLCQIGVEVGSTGSPTLLSSELNQDFAEERGETNKARELFEIIRKKLWNDVDRIAKGKLVSSSTVHGLSSISYQSDDQILEESDESKARSRNIRPKSASLQELRKRNTKKRMKKFVRNDIDENGIIDRMQLAQKAIDSHRECIQQLLQTTTHSPNSLSKINNSSSFALKNESEAEALGEGINQYNKMPNLTSRRVVFVNLDEDS